MEQLNTQTSGRAGVLVANDNQPRQLRSRVIEALERGERHVVIDCGSWRTLDVLVLSSLVHSASACRASGATFELQNLSAEMRTDIEALQLGPRLPLRG